MIVCGTWLVVVWALGSGPAALTAAEELARCREAPACAQGSCTPRGGRCVPTTADDCLLTPFCRWGGECDVDAEAGTCRLSPKERCPVLPECAIDGLCAPDVVLEERGKPACRPSADGCRASLACKLYGTCHAGDVVCNASAESCASSLACPRDGPCWARVSAETTGCVRDAEGCAQSRTCAWRGACAAGRPVCDPTAEGCLRSVVCERLGWCAPPAELPPGYYLRPDYASCHADSCGEARPCKVWRACTVDDRGGCVVRPQTPPTCELHRVYGLRATATSTRRPSDGLRFDAALAVDRDARTAWVPADGDARATLTVHLPTAERVTRIWVRNTFERDHPRLDMLARAFGHLLHAVVRVGDQVEMLNDLRWSVTRPPRASEDGPFGVSVVVPPTLTKRVAIEVDLVLPGLLFRAPAITEVVVEACGP